MYCNGRSQLIGANYQKRMLLLLDAIDGATCVNDLRGAYGFHALKGDRKGSYAMDVSGNWRLTFHFEHGDRGDVLDLGFEDYH